MYVVLTTTISRSEYKNTGWNTKKKLKRLQFRLFLTTSWRYPDYNLRFRRSYVTTKHPIYNVDDYEIISLKKDYNFSETSRLQKHRLL